MQAFKTAVKECQASLAPDLKNFFNSLSEHLQDNLHLISNVSQHLTEHKGKFLRPMFILLMAHVLGSKNKNHVLLSIAIECIHIATILHDDIIDKSDLRHNKPAVHKIWNNSTAILMGDFLFSKAFQAMVEIGDLSSLGILASASTVIAKGELQQLENIDNLDLHLESYLEIIRTKTALLFETATQLSGSLGGLQNPELKPATDVGLNFGLAYQIVDDINDFAPSSNTIGKNPGDDISEGKVTLPVILGLQKATEATKQKLVNLLREVKNSEHSQETATLVTEVTNILNELGAFESAKKQARIYTNRALQSLDALPTKSQQHKELFASIFSTLTL